LSVRSRSALFVVALVSDYDDSMWNNRARAIGNRAADGTAGNLGGCRGVENESRQDQCGKQL
jgi:hypothetical protein